MKTQFITQDYMQIRVTTPQATYNDIADLEEERKMSPWALPIISAGALLIGGADSIVEFMISHIVILTEIMSY